MDEKQKENLGLLIDSLDNCACGLAFPLPAEMHVAALSKALPEKVKELKELFIEITGENTWK
jgi:hypothetical protein